MKAQMEADRSKNTLEIALQSAKVLAWRYNYLTKQITDSHTLGKAYHLPKVIENVPEAIVNMGFIHKDSVKDFLQMFDNMKSGNVITSYEFSSPEFRRHQKLKTADELLESINDDLNDEAEIRKFNAVKNRKILLEAYANGETHFEVTYHIQNNARWANVVYDLLENPYTGDIELISSIHDVTDRVRSQLVVDKLLEVEYQSILVIDNETGIAYPFNNNAQDQNLQEITAAQEETGDKDLGLEAFFRAYALPDKVEEVIQENKLETIKKELSENPYYECMYTLNQNGKIGHYKVIYAYLEGDEDVMLSAVQDVTALYEKEMKQKEELSAALVQAEAANRAKTAFLSRVSHDMRTPLNGILGLTGILKARVTDDSMERDLSEMEMSGKYLLNLINDTLDVSRIESGKMELHPVVCEGKSVFNNALGLAKASMKKKNITCHVHADDIPFTMLYVDIARIEQVIMNVVGNAVKFTPEGGSIDFSLENLSVENGVITDKVTIRDTGIGISPEFLPHIFEAFSQEDATRTNSYEGTGLGMSITKQLLELMGGDISVESELGKGSCFTIILKLNIATEEQIKDWKKMQVSIERDISLSGKRILLVEDHPLNAEIAKRVLEAKGILVDHAENGQVGVDMFSKSLTGYYDAILMDIRMPVMDGIEATKMIRNLSRRDARMIPIIAMTANALSDDVNLTRDAGMDAHLSKPIETDVLYSTLSDLLKVNRDIQRKKILVVDDIALNRAIIRDSLESDYDVIEAVNGKEAWELIQTSRGLDAVITDIQMPEMDGIELTRKIRSDGKYNHLVIIANTQYGNHQQEDKLIDLGADDFVYKPSSPKVIGIRVRNALRR